MSSPKNSLVEPAAFALLERVGARRDRFIVAFSGGLDSTVLLHLAVRFAASRGVGVQAVHVDHGLHAASADWARHCETTAAALGARFECVRLEPPAALPGGLEAWARAARYGALCTRVDARTCVLTGHHADDQAETVLHRALQGAGPHGLSGVRELLAFGRGLLARPLLACERAGLHAYAREHRLAWLEDPSNDDPVRTRNRLRHELLPALEAAVPGAARGLRRLGAIQADLARALDTLADATLDEGPAAPRRLAIATLVRAAPALRPYVLKRWLARAGLSVPGERHLAELLHAAAARGDAAPVVRWRGGEVRRYAGHFHALYGQPPEPPARPTPWQPPSVLTFAHGQLSAQPVAGAGLACAALAAGPVSVRWRRGGERCRPAGRGVTRSLKKLLQDWQVPPWERALVPLVYVGEELAAVGSWCVAEPFAAAPGSAGYAIRWEPYEPGPEGSSDG